MYSCLQQKSSLGSGSQQKAPDSTESGFVSIAGNIQKAGAG
jgi:hypothetical protein